MRHCRPDEPGEMGAEICTSSRPDIWRKPAMIPLLMLLSRPAGFPIAYIVVPGFGTDLARLSGGADNSPLTVRTARSLTESTRSILSDNLTAPRSINGLPSRTTCWLVTILLSPTSQDGATSTISQ